MANLNWVLVNDLHYGVKNGSPLFHGIVKRFMEEQLLPFIDANGVKTVFMLGDFFDSRKSINVESIVAARESFLEPLSRRGVQVLMIAGNHDVFYRNTNRVNSLDAIIGKSYDNVRFWSSPETITVEGVRVLMLPWLNSENMDESVREVAHSDARFVMSHLELAGFEFSKGVMAEHGQIEVDSIRRFEQVFTGHYHHKSSRGNIHYLGTQYEMTWADYGSPKGFHHFDGETLSFIENPEKTFHRLVFSDEDQREMERELVSLPSYEGKYVKLVVKHKKKGVNLERFIQKILESNPHDLTVVDESTSILVTEEKEIAAPATLIETIREFVYNNLDTTLERERIMGMVQKVYFAAKEVSDDE